MASNMRQEKKREQQILQQSMDVLCQKLKPDEIIHYMRMKNILSRKEEDRLLQITNRQMRTRELLTHLTQYMLPSFHQLKIALIKSGQSELLQFLVYNDIKEDDDHLMKSYDGKCFIHLQDNYYVVAKEYRGHMYIHIRTYEERGSEKIPTKQGVALTYSRWLLLEMKRHEISDLYGKALNGLLDDEEHIMHLGGGIYVTISSKYQTIDIRHFWKPDNSDKPVATKKGVALNLYKWERLCDVMELIRDFVPELDNAIICRESHSNEMELSACNECSPFEEDEEDHISPNQEGNLQISMMMPDFL